MDVASFWILIDQSRGASHGNITKQSNLLTEILASRPVDEILAFETILHDLMDNAYDAALWDAAYIIGCGCGDSGFRDFRAWLIAQGKDTYTNALQDPESLIDSIGVDEHAQEGNLIYVAMDAYRRKTGHELTADLGSINRPPPKLKGEGWPEDEKERRFPKLAAKFGDCLHRDIW